MTGVMTEAEVLALLGTDRCEGLRWAADLRESRALAATEGPYRSVDLRHQRGGQVRLFGLVHLIGNILASGPDPLRDAVHIAAEANPAHALAEVRLWRGIAERHSPTPGLSNECRTCLGSYQDETGGDWPCPDVLAAEEAARAYLGGGS